MGFALRPRLRLPGLPCFLFAIGLLTPALATARAQDAGAPPQQSDQQSDPDQERDIGWISGHIIGPTGLPQSGGVVSLSTDGGVTLRYNITVAPKGDYTGRVPLGEYTLVYRAPGVPEGKVTDYIHSVVINAGKGTVQDVDMTRQEYFDRLTPEQQAQLLKFKASNDEAAVTNKAIPAINADLHTANQDFEDAENARAAAIQTLGSTASTSDVDAAAYDIKVAKYTEVESLMTKAAAELPGEPAIWVNLGRAQIGLKNYIDAEISFKKAIELITQPANPDQQGASIDPLLTGAAYAGLGEVYARTLMVDEAHASFAAAAKADPGHAAMYLRNLAIIYFQEKKAWAQVDAADEAIKANPQDALLYFIKAQGLAIDARVDPDTNQLKLSPECVVAFREYLGLAPTGEYAAQVTSILERAGVDNPTPQNAGTVNQGVATAPATSPAQPTAPAQN